MGLMDWLKKGKDAINKNINPEYGKNKDFLEAMAAAAAFVAAADGDVSEDERRETITSLTAHPTLGKLYSKADIQEVSEKMLSRVNTQSGRLQLNRELDDLNGSSQQMREDVYYLAADIASADGNVSAQEEAVLKRLAAKLKISVDTTI